MSKQNIYDNDLFYENFEKIRSKEINFNDIIETPIILGMIPEPVSYTHLTLPTKLEV